MIQFRIRNTPSCTFHKGPIPRDPSCSNYSYKPNKSSQERIERRYQSEQERMILSYKGRHRHRLASGIAY